MGGLVAANGCAFRARVLDDEQRDERGQIVLRGLVAIEVYQPAKADWDMCAIGAWTGIELVMVDPVAGASMVIPPAIPRRLSEVLRKGNEIGDGRRDNEHA